MNVRKLVFAAVGITSSALVMVFGFFALLPLKIEAIMQNIVGHETARMESYVDHRVEAIIYRRIYANVTGQVASEGFYTDNTIMATLWGNLSKDRFEKQLLDRGIKIRKVGARGIRFDMPDGSNFTANSAEDLLQHVNKDLKGKAARVAIKGIVNDHYKPWRIIKRRHVRRYIKNAYNIKRWAIKKQEDKPNETDEKLPGSTLEEVQADVTNPPRDLEGVTVGCFGGSEECPNTNERGNADGSSEAQPPKATDPNDAGDDEAEGRQATKDGIGEGVDGFQKAESKATVEVLEKTFLKTVTDKIFDAVPVVGWLALASDFDHIFWGGGYVQIKVALHSAQYAALGSTWLSLNDQFKAGQLTASQINKLLGQLNDVEKSNAAQRIFYNNADGGVKLSDDKMVGSDASQVLDGDGGGGPCNIAYFITHPTPPGNADIKSATYWTQFYRWYASSPLTGSPLGFHAPLCVLHGFINQLAKYASGILSPLFDLALKGVNASISVIVGHSIDVRDYAKSAISWMVAHIWTPVVTGREVGPELGNAIDAGWDVIANGACRDTLGCANIPLALAYEQDAQIAADNRAALKQNSLLANLVNTDYPESFGTQMLTLVPGTPGAALGRVATSGLAAITNPFASFSRLFASFFSPAYADDATVREPNGVQLTGYTESQLEDPVLHVATTDVAGPPGSDGKLTGPDGRIDQYDCDSTIEGASVKDVNAHNQCLLDTAAAQALCAGSGTDDDGGLGGHGDPGGCGDIETTDTDTTTNPGDPGTPETSEDVKELALKILANKNITYTPVDAGRVSAHDVIVALSEGKLAPTEHLDGSRGATDVNPRLLQMLLYIAQNHQIMVGYITNGHHQTQGGENTHTIAHAAGAAMDINAIDGVSMSSTGASAAASKIIIISKLAIDFMKASNYPQLNINTGLTLSSQITSYASANGVDVYAASDTADHLHMAVPWK